MKIIVTEPDKMAERVEIALAQLGEISFGPFSQESLVRELVDSNVLLVRFKHYVSRDLLDCAPKLEYLLTPTTGLDHIDLKAAENQGIRIISLRDCRDKLQDISATAEHTWGLLLALLRKTSAAAQHVLEGGWDRTLFWGEQLKGKKLGIIGYGRIGAMVARYGTAFGMEVIAYDSDPAAIYPPTKFVPIEELVKKSDFISIHITADINNRHMFGRQLVDIMKPSSYLINTARGMLVDTICLAKAIESGQIAGAAFDVLENEGRHRTKVDPLVACARAGYNVIITPHIGGATVESIEAAESAVVSVLKEQLMNKPLKQ